MGVAYIAGILIQSHYQVSILDININSCYNFNEIQNKLETYDFDVIGITGLVAQYNYIKKETTYLLKSLYHDKKIIIGGFIGSTVPDLLLQKTKADIIAIGEGEVTIIELLKAIEEEKDLSSIDGLAFKKNEEIFFTKKEI